jgi:hypothetical protein
MGWNTKIARKKAKAVLQIALTIAIIACLNGFIEYIKVLPENGTMVFYNKPLEIPAVKAAEVEEIAPVVVAEPVVKENPTREKIDSLLKKAFDDEEVEHARRVVWCESRYNANAHNYNPATGDDSVGLSQINLLGNLFPGRLMRAQHIGYDGEATREALIEWLKTPENNIKYLASMKATNGWDDWSCDSMVKDKDWKYRPQMLVFLGSK